jgi:hypothetical protein
MIEWKQEWKQKLHTIQETGNGIAWLGWRETTYLRVENTGW